MAGVDPPAPAAIEVGVDGPAGRALITLRGELDLTTTPPLERALAPLLARADIALLVFDMAGLELMDSSGIAVLLKAAVGGGKQIHLRHAPEVIREVVMVTGLAGILQVDP